MTVIAYKNGVLAADSCNFSGGMRFQTEGPKVVRGDRGLFGTCGRSSDGWLARRWFLSGMSAEKPNFSNDKDEPVQCLWVQRDGSVWWGDERLQFTPLAAPQTIGETTATAFVDGAMAAGASAEEAVGLAIKHCVYVGGAVCAVRL